MTVCNGCHQLFDGLADYCPECRLEMEDWIEEPTCSKCNGSGEIEWDDGICSVEEMIICPICKGTGIIEEEQ